VVPLLRWPSSRRCVPLAWQKIDLGLNVFNIQRQLLAHLRRSRAAVRTFRSPKQEQTCKSSTNPTYLAKPQARAPKNPLGGRGHLINPVTPRAARAISSWVSADGDEGGEQPGISHGRIRMVVRSIESLEMPPAEKPCRRRGSRPDHQVERHDDAEVDGVDADLGRSRGHSAPAPDRDRGYGLEEAGRNQQEHVDQQQDDVLFAGVRPAAPPLRGR